MALRALYHFRDHFNMHMDIRWQNVHFESLQVYMYVLTV